MFQIKYCLTISCVYHHVSHDHGALKMQINPLNDILREEKTTSPMQMMEQGKLCTAKLIFF